jgi:flagellar hook-basal body complex protein FliE
MNDIRQGLPPLQPIAEPVAGNAASPAARADDGVDFGSMVKDTIDEVNRVQKGAAQLAERFEKGDADVDLVRVMVEMQKSRVSFEAVSQVRNKLVEAYREVMNMQV